MSEQVETCQDWDLCVYVDATYIALKRDTVLKETFYIAVGIHEDESKEVRGYCYTNESAFIWKGFLEDIKSRGTEEILLFISDRAEVCEDFKNVYRVENLELGYQALQSFVKKWKFHKTIAWKLVFIHGL